MHLNCTAYGKQTNLVNLVSHELTSVGRWVFYSSNEWLVALDGQCGHFLMTMDCE